MDRWIIEHNLARYESLLKETSDAGRRSLLKALIEDERKQLDKLDVKTMAGRAAEPPSRRAAEPPSRRGALDADI